MTETALPTLAKIDVRDRARIERGLLIMKKIGLTQVTFDEIFEDEGKYETFVDEMDSYLYDQIRSRMKAKKRVIPERTYKENVRHTINVVFPFRVLDKCTKRDATEKFWSGLCYVIHTSLDILQTYGEITHMCIGHTLYEDSLLVYVSYHGKVLPDYVRVNAFSKMCKTEGFFKDEKVNKDGVLEAYLYRQIGKWAHNQHRLKRKRVD